MNYDATRDALLRPELHPTFFSGAGVLPAPAVCAELARLSYLRFEDGDAEQAALQQALTLGGLGQAHTFATRRSSTQGYVVASHDGQDAYVVFRGTQAGDPTDIGTDADICLQPWPQGGMVHTGFVKALDSVWDSVQAWLGANRATRLCFVGHSLGAGLATVAFSRAGLANARLVTFGSPRVGDHAFVAGLHAPAVERYVNCCDIVPNIPPEGFLGYTHIEPMRYIDHSGKLYGEGPAAGAIEDDRAGARLRYLFEQAWRRDTCAIRDLADHSLVNYIRAFLR
jgi:hypothetical protein